MEHPIAVVAIAVLALLCGMWLGRRAHASQAVRRAGRARRLGAEGERLGLALLARRGYRLVETQVSRELFVLVDGNKVPYRVRADAIVRKRSRRYVAEIKGGRVAAAVTTVATRRQLLEYSIAFEADGLLLVDAYAGVITEVVFPARR